jgi:hypothetical protein
MITKFDKPSCKMVGQEIEKALQAFAAQHGITIQYGGGSIKSDIDFSLKLRLQVADPAAREAGERQEFKMYCGIYHLTEDHYGKVAQINGRAMRLVGFAPNRPKFPLKAQCLDNGEIRLLTEKSLPRFA